MADNVSEPEYWQFVPIIILWIVWCACIGGTICSFTCCTLRCYNSFDGIRSGWDRRRRSCVNLSYVPALSSNQNPTTVEGVLDEEENAV